MNLYLALSRGTEKQELDEPEEYTGYERIEIKRGDFFAEDFSFIYNSKLLAFPTPIFAWKTIYSLAICLDKQENLCILHKNISLPKFVGIDEKVSFVPGDLCINYTVWEYLQKEEQ